MDEQKEYEITEKRLAELKELRRKNGRRNAFLFLVALQAGSVLLSYYLGRSHR